MKSVGIFGGTFDPVHIGHLITARYVLEQRNLEKIIFIPCFISPHKLDDKSVTSKHRLEMVKLAIAGTDGFEYSDYEISKEGISYTLDTVKHFKKLYSNIELIIGYDNLVVFDKWHKPDEILSLAKLAVMHRKVDKDVIMEHDYHLRAELVETPVIEISSSEIRERISKKLPVDFLLPESVKNYVITNNLYAD